MAVDVPEYISANARRALDDMSSKGGGVTPKTLREARQLANGTASENKVTRMAAWFARHKSDLQSPRAAAYLNGDGKMTAGQWAWLAWGGDITTANRMRAMEWAERTRDRLAKEISASVTAGLKRKVEEHNEKHGGAASKRVNLRMLGAVFERGVGAYNTNPGSVRPGVASSDQWAYARVNAFLTAVRTGKFPGGAFDTDLLPEGHPLSTRKELADSLTKETKREDGEDFPEEAFAYVPDADKPSTWKLRLWDSIEEKETAAQVGRALAALGRGGFRGNRVKIPRADLPKVKGKVLAAWRKTHPDATSDEEPTVLKAYGYDEEEYKDYSDDASGADAMTHLLMAYRLMLDHPECAPLLEPLMALIHMKEQIMLENIDETHIVLPAEMETDDESMLYRRTTRKVVVQEDGQFCVRSEESGRNFGCYRTVELAEARLEQIESFAKRRIIKASNEELTAWHDRLHLSVSVTDGMVACHNVIEDELEARQKSVELVKSMSGSLPVVKAEENRFTLGPVYVPGFEDAHGEFTDEDTLQKALWGWMKANDRTIYLQHSEKAAGEMVELLTWPMPIETALEVPNEGVTKYAFPANTPFMGVIWEPWAWEMVKAGELRGYSIGGTSQRMEADLPESALV